MAQQSKEAARAAVREIGRLTVIRLTLYYVMAGVLLLCVSALLPSDAIRPSGSGQPPTDITGAIEWFRGQVAMFPGGAPRWLDALFQMISAFLLVLPLAFVYVRTRTRVKFDHSLVQTVIVLPIVVTAILVVVRDSLALAFSLAGHRGRGSLPEQPQGIGRRGLHLRLDRYRLRHRHSRDLRRGGPVGRLRGRRAGALEVRLQRRVRPHLRPPLPPGRRRPRGAAGHA